MQVNVAGIRRNIKNLAHNYSDAQVKVREATSNDPWGPSATIMAEIADLTYNVVAFSEIMQMIWKRLNDHGKNWRHVYKALKLLEYLIKTGTEKVAQQCKENIFAIQTLRDFVYFEEGKDQGTHVREKAKQLVNLLKDDERLKNERIKALKAKERFAQHPSGFGSDGYIDGPTHRDVPPGWQEEPKAVSDLELVRPQTAGEEELQLQLAMAMSREEAEQEEAKRRSDDVRLQLALSQSEQDFKDQTVHHVPAAKEEQQSHLLDLLEINLGAASISSPPLGATGGINTDPWGAGARAASQLSDPWSGTSSPPIDPWHPNQASRTNVPGMPLGAVAGSNDAWAMRTQSPSLASGSSTEGWLPTNGGNALLNGNGASTSSAAAVTLSSDPWHGGKPNVPTAPLPPSGNADPWISDSPKPATVKDPWAPKSLAAGTVNDDPWRTLENSEKKISPDLDDFDIITNRNKTAEPAPNNNNALLLEEMDPLSNTLTSTNNGALKKPLKTPQAFLGENSSLVNLDNLIKPVAPQGQPGVAYNPFSDTILPPKTNLFQQQQPAVPSINQLKQQQPFAMSLSQDPWAPSAANNLAAQQENKYARNEEIENISPNPIYKQRPNSLNLNSINNNGTLNSNNSNTFERIMNRNVSQMNRSFPQKQPQHFQQSTLQHQNQNTKDYDVFNAIHHYESVFDEPSSASRYGNYNKSLYSEVANNNNTIYNHNSDEYYNNTLNDNDMSVSSPLYQLDQSNTIYPSVSNYSSDFIASLAATPGIRIEPNNLHTTVATVHASYSGETETAVCQSASRYFENNMKFDYSTAIGQTDKRNIGSAPLSMENNVNNNNVSWIKPEAAASNPFLS